MVNLRRFQQSIQESSQNVQVLSLNVQANMVHAERPRSQFEIMVRHLFDRMLNNEAFGEEAATRMTQLALAIALPGVLVALFLFAAYHQPNHHTRDLWSQTADHMFYVTYAFVIMGMAIVFQWEMLFPDLLDVYVLTSLPIPRLRLLLGRITALAIFLGLVQIETSGLGNIFFPGVADLKTGFFRHVFAHAAGVTMAGLFAATFFIALQGLLVCLPARISAKVSSTVKIASIIALLTVLFLFPLVAHSVEKLLAMQSTAVHWYPPFWFLGIYETVLYGRTALPIFHQLARTGLTVTAALATIGALLYPLAYTRRVRQLIEGAGIQKGSNSFAKLLHHLLHATILRTPRARAIFHFAAQTLARLQRLHLYLAMYAGAGLAFVLSGLTLFQTDGDRLHVVVSPNGVRIAIPVLAFWIIAGLRTALQSPLGTKGSWIFRVIGGQPAQEELRATELLVDVISLTLTLAAVLILHFIAPPEMRTPLAAAAQVVLAIGLCLLLTDLAFLFTRSLPFTIARKRSTRELPITLVQYFVLFPFFCLKVVENEPWIEASPVHLLKTAIFFAIAHATLRWVRTLVLRSEEPADEGIFLGLGLREQ
ncbi:hypothetical protein [Granulicella sibirica]|uniref:Uncharacterized protein n=1 Tax=Granulicella sibirica TaxID=2479048 RepID=A0A4Q0T9I9_9BACT|nr:hypothetical protein [Granulicella sibirica]RXH58778.1 hypothetical protein GRAN_2088 [Granulicella sibirica]